MSETTKPAVAKFFNFTRYAVEKKIALDRTPDHATRSFPPLENADDTITAFETNVGDDLREEVLARLPGLHTAAYREARGSQVAIGHIDSILDELTRIVCDDDTLPDGGKKYSGLLKHCSHLREYLAVEAVELKSAAGAENGDRRPA